MADKKFTIAVAPVLVDATKVATAYRIDFSGPEAVDAVSIPYDSLEARTVSFSVAGDYTATAGLYDQNGELLGASSSVPFTVEAGGPNTVEVRAVSGLTVEPVATLRRR